MNENTDTKRPQVTLFNVDGQNTLTDYKLCHNDLECGEYLFRQVELALGGAYIPKETIYCLDERIEAGTDIPRLLEDCIRQGDIHDMPSFLLRELTFLYEKSGVRLPENMADILILSEETVLNPQSREMLKEYDSYHAQREQDIKSRTITGIETGPGTMFFDDSGRGLRNMGRYLQYIADNYFLPEFQGTEGLNIYYFSTSNRHIAEIARKSAGMLVEGEDGPCLTSPSGYMQPQGIMKDYAPAMKCPMNPDKAGYDNFLQTFNLFPDKRMEDIACLLEIRERGIESPERRHGGFLHKSCFEKICERLDSSLLELPAHSPLVKVLQQTAKDMAGRILQMEYGARGYRASMQGKVPESPSRRAGSIKGTKPRM